MKKILIIGAVIIVIGFILLISIDAEPEDTASERIIGETLSVTTFTHGGESTGKVLLQIPFLKTLDNNAEVTIEVDSNSDGVFEDTEKLATNVPVFARSGWNGGTYVETSMNIQTGLPARASIKGEVYDLKVEASSVDVGTLLDLESITDPENAMKGLGTKVAFAQSELQITNPEIPDLSQKPGECAPTAAANSLISLIARHGNPADLPGTPEEMIEDLKGEMNWTMENGVPPDDFVSGKNAWAEKHGLPIETTKVGDVHGISTLEAITEALNEGAAVEMRIKFARTGSNQAAGGHMVTVVGVREVDGQTYIDINDPYTPEGTETVNISSNQLTNYGPWGGITVMSWGFIQKWSIDGEAGEESTRTGLDTTPVAVEMSFTHTVPGEYSEVFAVVMTTPGNEVTAKLTGPSVEFKGTQHVIADENGQARFVWKIFNYGTYTASGNIEGGNPFTGTVTVN